MEKDPRKRVHMNQENMYLVMMRVMSNLVVTHHVHDKMHELIGKVYHLWFPERGNMERYQLRTGNPPADVDRPDHLKGKDLVIDLTTVPDGMMDRIKERLRGHERSKYKLVKTPQQAALEGDSLIVTGNLNRDKAK